MVDAIRKTPKKHKMKLNSRPFDAISSGVKTIELRLYDEKRRAICVGDLIEFVCVGYAGNAGFADNAGGAVRVGEAGERVLRRVAAMHVFSSFDELYSSLPLERCGYTADEVARGEARARDMREYYSEDDEARYGVVGIELSGCASECATD